MSMFNSLSDCIIYGSTQDVAVALAKMDNLNYLDEYGYTPLIETCVANEIDKATLLLDKQADPNMLDITGRSPLHWAAENSNLELCEKLLAAGANVNAYNIASEPIIVKPLLRRQDALKELFIQHGASLSFAYDYINTKLLGHRFELIGSADIVDPNNVFTEVDYEGFYFEFSLNVIQHSLFEYAHNFASRSLRHLASDVDTICNALRNAASLSQYDQYLIDVNQHKDVINTLLKHEPLVIPISQEGHALTMVKQGNLFAIIDRAHRDAQHDVVEIYYMNSASRLSNALLTELIYKKQHVQAIHNSIPSILNLQKFAEIPIHAQIMGNCSWANVEAVIPTLYTLIHLNSDKTHNTDGIIEDALELYQRWREWDKSRALQFAMQNFPSASPARKASIAAVLAGILFQRCSADSPEDVARAKKILP